MKTKNSYSVILFTEVSDEIFAFISACASVLTNCQSQNNEALYLASNLWDLYNQLGGDKRARSIREFEKKIRTSNIGL